MNLVLNEQATLSATYLSGLAIAMAAIGGVGPWVGFAQGRPAPVGAVAICSIVCIALSLILHLVARTVLGSLREP